LHEPRHRVLQRVARAHRSEDDLADPLGQRVRGRRTRLAVRILGGHVVNAGMNEASSLARNATAAASSSGSAKRPTGTWIRRRAARSGSFANSSFSSGVLTGPGHSALIRTPLRANSTPSSRVIASTPPL